MVNTHVREEPVRKFTLPHGSVTTRGDTSYCSLSSRSDKGGCIPVCVGGGVFASCRGLPVSGSLSDDRME